MKFNNIFFLLLFFLISKNTEAQDIHWSMFNMAPSSLNPAFTGDHNKAFRAGINYRSQWNSIPTAKGFNTASVHFDAPVFSAGNNSWIGLGLLISNDKAGTNGLSNTGIMGTVAAHMQLSKQSIFSIGFQGGLVNRKIETSNLLFEEQIDIRGVNAPFTNDVNNGLFANNTNLNHTDLNLGMKYYSSYKNGSNLVIGGTIRHIATMNNFVEEENLPMLITLHGRMDLAINKQFSFLPGLVYYQSGSANQINLQALARYKMGKRNSKTSFIGGFGYRAIDNDALMAIVQLDFSTYKIGFAYDITMSQLSQANNSNGGLELSFIYLGGDKKSFSTKVGCPTF